VGVEQKGGCSFVPGRVFSFVWGVSPGGGRGKKFDFFGGKTKGGRILAALAFQRGEATLPRAQKKIGGGPNIIDFSGWGKTYFFFQTEVFVFRGAVVCFPTGGHWDGLVRGPPTAKAADCSNLEKGRGGRGLWGGPHSNYFLVFL